MVFAIFKGIRAKIGSQVLNCTTHDRYLHSMSVLRASRSSITHKVPHSSPAETPLNASLVISDPIGYLLISGVRNFSSSAHQRSLAVFNGSDFTGMALFLSIEPVGLKNGIKPHYYSYHSNSANSNFFQLPLLGFLYKEQEFYSTGPGGQPICV